MGSADDEDTFLGKATRLEATTRKVVELYFATNRAQFEDTIFYYHSVLIFGKGQGASDFHLFTVHREEGIGTTCIARVDAAIPQSRTAYCLLLSPWLICESPQPNAMRF